MRELPIKIQTIVYKEKNGEMKVLLLKRSEEDGGFWQTVTGTLEIDESIVDSRMRELSEETGIDSVLGWSDELHRFSWEKKDYTVVELVYAAEVSSDQQVVLSEEHTEYIWATFDDAMDIVGKDNTKRCLKKAKELLA